MKLKPIGIINSPYKKRGDAPRQGRYSEKISKITVFDEYKEGLQDIGRKKYYYVFYWLDRAERDKLKGIPPGRTEERGVFSIRSPARPNPIAMCLVEIVNVPPFPMKHEETFLLRRYGLPILILILPSCGKRRSAILRSAMILKRLMIAA